MNRMLAFACDCLRARLCPPETMPLSDDKQDNVTGEGCGGGGVALFDADCKSHGFTGEEVPHRVMKKMSA